MTHSGEAPQGEAARRLRVTIVYHCVAHYRDPVFRELVSSGRERGVEYEVAADTVPNVASIRVIDQERFAKDLNARWIALRNRWLPARFLWQHGLVPFVFREPPDALIFLGDFHMLSTWVSAILARARGVRIFMWTHGYLRREHGPKGYVRYLFYRLADALLVYGRRAKGLLEERGYPASRIHVIFNSLDHEKQLAIRKELQSSSRGPMRKRLLDVEGEDEKVFAFAGRLEAFKGLELLLAAFARLAATRPRVKLVCIGDGPIRESLEDQAKRLEIDKKVLFWGACYDEEVMGRLFHAADVCVSPGPVGLLAIHSLVYGTPVLISDDIDRHGPEYEVIADGVTGAFFRSGSVQELADGMAAAAERFAKPKVCDACFRAVDEHYTPKNQASIITRVVREHCDA